MRRKHIKEICLLLEIIRYIHKNLKLQKICFKYKDLEEAELMSKEIIDWIEELGLDK